MKIHHSHYEEDLGWINIYTLLPEPNTRVKLANVRIIDWNIEELVWETEGWITKNGNWSLKQKIMIDNNTWKNLISGVNNKPTHWKM